MWQNAAGDCQGWKVQLQQLIGCSLGRSFRHQLRNLVEQIADVRPFLQACMIPCMQQSDHEMSCFGSRMPQVPRTLE